jgi:hypothetical protein
MRGNKIIMRLMQIIIEEVRSGQGKSAGGRRWAVRIINVWIMLIRASTKSS